MTLPVESGVIVNGREVILLSGNGQGSPKTLRNTAAQIHEHTRALVLCDFDGTTRIEQLSAAQMREYGWVRVEELNAAVEQARRAAS